MIKYDTLINAVKSNSIKEVKKVLSNPKLKTLNNPNINMRYAAEYGFSDILKLLLSDDRFDPTENNAALDLASRNGHTEIVKLLLNDPRIDPTFNNYAIQLSSSNGHFEIVKLLLKDKRVEPNVDNNYPFRAALTKGYINIKELLFKNESVKKYLKKEDYPIYKDFLNKDLKEKIGNF
jgi:ankyrin repeat protein